MRYDIAIIGSGPAGLSAAVNAKIRNKSFIIFGNKTLSNKIEKAPSIDNYLGLYNISGGELKERFENHINAMDIEIDEHKITNVYAMGDYFALTSGSEMFEATTVIIAIGTDSAKSIEGEDTFLGRGVSYCATCDAPLYKGKNVCVLGYNEEAIHEANFLNEIASKTYFVPMRNTIKKDLSSIDEKIEILEKKPTSIEGEMLVNKLNFQDESLDIDGVFIIKDSMSPKNLVPGLELDGQHIKVDANMKTNIAGLFACGDCVGRPYSYLKSAGQGLTAALNAVDYLAKKDR
ncbi:NAD(P)/FAD-dependent oxidoreductase [Intestinibacter bartlettii]|uniref:NAD(P)/FAD-dependent oxidoreductase n=1 Tax=Intestinibacter bartlettii TaxID=261299 RepID=A0ABS6DZQ5_9FIRM|nr:NAD(P)/FAD-dependent oxidoreductase [Intestinibacter bartlettii]MBU5336888.1 NAD(P)/FAD-dependent oxidoreductase [Intestinibacter bartlettii]MDO5011058.1 NAD(P)/FAD-dependent oxidoreductase [Intestinibacter bartlettii]